MCQVFTEIFFHFRYRPFASLCPFSILWLWKIFTAKLDRLHLPQFTAICTKDSPMANPPWKNLAVSERMQKLNILGRKKNSGIVAKTTFAN